MFCKYCGEKIDDDAKFCPKCGARLARQGTDAATDASSGAGDSVNAEADAGVNTQPGDGAAAEAVADASGVSASISGRSC